MRISEVVRLSIRHVGMALDADPHGRLYETFLPHDGKPLFLRHRTLAKQTSLSGAEVKGSRDMVMPKFLTGPPTDPEVGYENAFFVHQK